MYGLILENIATSIKEKFGEEKWQEIKKIAGIKETHFGVRYFQGTGTIFGYTTIRKFQIDTIYSEGHTIKLIWAARDVTGKSIDELMEMIGRDFYSFTSKYDYHRVIY